MGVPIIAQLARQNGANFPIAAAEDIIGAFATVPDIAARDAIPTNVLRIGAIVRIGNTASYYEWLGAAWSALAFGGGGSLDWKDSVRFATTTALSASTRVSNTRTANANGTFPTVDGVTPAVGDRFLDKDHATGADRGLWQVVNLGSVSTPWVIVRTGDADSSSEVTGGCRIPVVEGSANGGKTFKLDTADPITLNTTALSFSLDTAAPTTAGNGLTGTTTLSVLPDGPSLAVSGSGVKVAAGGVGATELAANAVTTAKIADANVTPAKFVGGKAVNDIGAVAVATTTNVALTGTPAGIDAGATLTSGVSRVLVPFQTAPAENGVYVYNSGGAWARASDAATASDFRKGVFFVIDQGATYGGCLAACIIAPTTVGTDPVQYGITQSPGLSAAQLLHFFGDGSDGAVTVNTTINLTRDMHYTTLTLGASGVINMAGHRIFCSVACDISAAATGAFRCNGGAGGAGGVPTAGTAGVGYNPVSVGGSTSGSAGGAGGNNAGSAGNIGAAGNNGGGSGTGGTGGSGSSGAGGAGGTTAAPVADPPRRWESRFVSQNGNALVHTRGGSTGGAGGGGGGNGSAPGGGGGGSGAGGGVGYLSCRQLITGSNTNPGIFQATAGDGGVGAAATNTNTGGGGGGPGGGGGWWFIAFLTRTGATIANAIRLHGGAGGAGGAGNGTGSGGDGGPGGDAGRATIINMGAGTTTDNFAGGAGGAGGAHSGATGGTAGTAGTYQVNL